MLSNKSLLFSWFLGFSVHNPFVHTELLFAYKVILNMSLYWKNIILFYDITLENET
jgi:hypothetical protein